MSTPSFDEYVVMTGLGYNGQVYKITLQDLAVSPPGPIIAMKHVPEEELKQLEEKGLSKHELVVIDSPIRRPWITLPRWLSWIPWIGKETITLNLSEIKKVVRRLSPEHADKIQEQVPIVLAQIKD